MIWISFCDTFFEWIFLFDAYDFIYEIRFISLLHDE